MVPCLVLNMAHTRVKPIWVKYNKPPFSFCIVFFSHQEIFFDSLYYFVQTNSLAFLTTVLQLQTWPVMLNKYMAVITEKKELVFSSNPFEKCAPEMLCIWRGTCMLHQNTVQLLKINQTLEGMSTQQPKMYNK